MNGADTELNGADTELNGADTEIIQRLSGDEWSLYRDYTEIIRR